MLYIIATPIGNLKDITLRALEILKSSNFVLAEDTRITKKLLSHYDISAPLISYQEHSPLKTYYKILDLLKDDKNLALVTDAGTPGISDPAAKLINFLSQNLGKDFKVSPIPGASALASAISISGIMKNGFVFLGFPPAKNKRKKFFESLKNYKLPLALYESPHRFLKTLEDLKNIFGEDKNIIVCRELTKIHEQILRLPIYETSEYFKNNSEKLKGEFVIILN